MIWVIALVVLMIGYPLYENYKYPEYKTWKQWYYEDYLRSDHWAHTRDKALLKANFMCQHCRSTYRLQVHHLSYKRLWEEEESDLVVLCRECHKEEHRNKKTA